LIHFRALDKENELVVTPSLKRDPLIFRTEKSIFYVINL